MAISYKETACGTAAARCFLNNASTSWSHKNNIITVANKKVARRSRLGLYGTHRRSKECYFTERFALP
jgi:hypothetical protein